MDILLKYFPDLTKTQKEKLNLIYNLYSEWNEKINVISRKDISKIYERHVLYSLSIAKVIEFKNDSKILDVGTGGGFPGIPLAILFPEVNFHLIDSIGKKIKVVNAVKEKLELTNVIAEQTRVEQINKRYDFVISRAVTGFPKFVDWVKKNISEDQKNSIPNGILYLKGGEFSDEIKSFKKRITVFELKEFFNEDFFETKKIIHLPI